MSHPTYEVVWTTTLHTDDGEYWVTYSAQGPWPNAKSTKRHPSPREAWQEASDAMAAVMARGLDGQCA